MCQRATGACESRIGAGHVRWEHADRTDHMDDVDALRHLSSLENDRRLAALEPCRVASSWSRVGLRFARDAPTRLLGARSFAGRSLARGQGSMARLSPSTQRPTDRASKHAGTDPRSAGSVAGHESIWQHGLVENDLMMVGCFAQRPGVRSVRIAAQQVRPVPVVALPTTTAVRRLQSRSTQDLFGAEAPGAAHRGDPMHGRSVDA